MIDICAVGPLRITNALYKAGKLGEGAKVSKWCKEVCCYDFL